MPTLPIFLAGLCASVRLLEVAFLGERVLLPSSLALPACIGAKQLVSTSWSFSSLVCSLSLRRSPASQLAVFALSAQLLIASSLVCSGVVAVSSRLSHWTLYLYCPRALCTVRLRSALARCSVVCPPVCGSLPAACTLVCSGVVAVYSRLSHWTLYL